MERTMSIEQFFELMLRSQLFGEPEIDKVAAEFSKGCRNDGTEETLQAFCKFLVGTGRLTKWQCAKLEVGKFKGFYLDNFVLLEQCGKDEVSSSYKARETRSGSLVCVVITPPAIATDGRKTYRTSSSGQIEYRVDPYIE